MKITFLGQGFESTSANAVGNYLIKYLSQKDFHSFTGMSAFASEAGVFGLAGFLQSAKPTFKNLTLIVGIDQDGTSKEALEKILSLDIESYIFYQKEAPIFHPKIYLFEGDQYVKLLIGSSNLTRTGLFTNVESSLLIEFDSTDDEGIALLTELKTYYQSLFDFSDGNLFKITTAVINDFFVRGIVPDEITRRKIYKRKNTSSQTSTNFQSGNAINIPNRTQANIPNIFPSKPRKKANSNITSQAPVTVISSPVTIQPAVYSGTVQNKTLVWQKLALSQSDAQQVPVGTKITANLKLSQARFKLNNVVIDQTTYFRNHIFRTLVWVHTKLNNNSYEEAFCQFDITIINHSYGVHNLKLSHDAVRIAGQGNTPTWLHWGNTFLPILQQTDVTGRTFNLYQSPQNYYIDIV